jgi:two-component system phosphate regulon response regulator PhoB/two-component system alkaline phosphatase synthesis response regulator PhoP
MSKLIAILDDEADILELVSIHLRKAGLRVAEFQEAEALYVFLKERTPHLLILDLMLPDTDGMDVCKSLKRNEKYSSMPIIILTAKAEETEKILGLELGADDYVTKPFSPKELVARVKAVLRRETENGKPRLIEVGGKLELDLQKYEVRVGGKKVALTPTEFRILQLLCSKRGWVLSRDKILLHLWGNEKAVTDRTVDVHIKNLREKLGEAKRMIKNIRGVGYKLEV